jgi:hypothetical protein
MRKSQSLNDNVQPEQLVQGPISPSYRTPEVVKKRTGRSTTSKSSLPVVKIEENGLAMKIEEESSRSETKIRES